MLKDSHRTQMILRLHIFHVLQTVSLHAYDIDAGVPARGLHGEAYRGHIFWDEVFILPFLNYRIPEISRSLLLYRYRRLPAARAAARVSELDGALYPWQSGSSGREESQVLHLNPRSGRWTPDNTYLQRHVNGAIAFNVWRYYEATGDRAFLASYGAEMFVEIARLWASLAKWNEATQRFDIPTVVGPDEFHDGYPWRDEPGLDNNAYTNVMAAWVLAHAGKVLDIILGGAAPRAGGAAVDRRRGGGEVGRGRPQARRALPRRRHQPVRGLREAGGARLGRLPRQVRRHPAARPHPRGGGRHGQPLQGLQAGRRADAVLPVLVRRTEHGVRPARLSVRRRRRSGRSIDYYLPRTSNGSTLCRIVHSWVLARRDRTRSWQMLKEALESDISDVQGGTTAEGIHLGAMAGTVDLVQRGQTALEIIDGVLHLNPCVPEELEQIELRLLYQGSRLEAEVGCDRVVVSAPEDWAGPNKIGVGNRVHAFRGGDRLEFATQLKGGGWRPITQRVKRKKQADVAEPAQPAPRRRRAPKAGAAKTPGG